ncbi:MAG: phytanoyl-CoA dioxygenase family protein [Phycisphaeraceae bacterium]|nr:phytanoyl-CoA dioxygenase family protein [Phycisphaeraceae bacterium]
MSVVTSLTESQREQYRTEGWVMLGRIMDDATLERMRAEELRFRQLRLAKDPALCNQTIFASQVCHMSEMVRRFCATGPQVELARQLVAPDLALWFNQFVTKNPDGDSGRSEFPWHQDNGYVAIDPPTNITIWVALDDVDERNGCVWVVPRSHEKGLLDHRRKSEDSWHLTLPVEGDGQPAILKAGEAVAFTGLTLHRSKLNHTNRPRRAFFMEYADARSRYSRQGEPWKPVTDSSNTWIVAGAAPIPDDF